MIYLVAMKYHTDPGEPWMLYGDIMSDARCSSKIQVTSNSQFLREVENNFSDKVTITNGSVAKCTVGVKQIGCNRQSTVIQQLSLH